MKRIAAALILMVASLGVLVSPVKSAAPEPSQVPFSWELDFEYKTPQAIRIQLPGEKSPKTFWYMVYTVTNHTGADQTFVPEFVLYTQTGQLLRSGTGVPFTAYEQIKKTVNNPLLQESTAVIGKLLQGNDNAKTSVAIWPDFDQQAGVFDVFVGGLSGEMTEITLPEAIEVTQTDVSGKQNKVAKTSMVLNKTLDLCYSVPGEASNRANVTPSLTQKSWVMR
jgi:hypothetical protein